RWLHDQNLQGSGKINLDLSGSGLTAVAYALVRPEPRTMRIVMLENHDVAYDVSYGAVAAAVRVPAQALSQVEWAIAPSAQPDGDGLLLVMNPDDPASAIVLYSHAGRVLSAAPANFHSIPLE
ncbi:MAG TPA: hypothetical protein VE998_07850, partial [Terriglobales bacterium]|nr:hypothetical protein [Terriglobales bacterium]